MLYNSNNVTNVLCISEGFLSCSGGRITANQFSEFSKFTVERIPQADVQKARELVEISKKIQSIQTTYVANLPPPTSNK